MADSAWGARRRGRGILGGRLDPPPCNNGPSVGLPGGGSVVSTSAEGNTPIIKGISPPSGLNKDMERRTGMDTFIQTPGEGEYILKLMYINKRYHLRSILHACFG